MVAEAFSLLVVDRVRHPAHTIARIGFRLVGVGGLLGLNRTVDC